MERRRLPHGRRGLKCQIFNWAMKKWKSPPAWEAGIEMSTYRPTRPSEPSRLPHGRRGLKSKAASMVETSSWSPPAWEAGIEIRNEPYR